MLNSFFFVLENRFLSFLENISSFYVDYLTLRLCLKKIKYKKYLDTQSFNFESSTKKEIS